MVTAIDMKHLRRCVDLARTALDEGDAPFGSILVAGSGEVLAEDRNRVSSGDNTRHPEFALARWAAENMTVEERGKATVYTSGEHCSMCAAAHGWVGLGRIVYACSSSQLAGWLAELGVPPSKVRTLPIQDIIRDAVIEGPVEELSKEVRQLHVQRHRPNDK
jgi:tRNA(Arg) A34 adenosine deaminase TadA